MYIDQIEYSDSYGKDIEGYAKKIDSIFQRNANMDKTAFLSHSIDVFPYQKRFVVMGEAYFSTSYHLIQQCLENNNDKKDSWIFPILFNIVHGIELYLKAINVNLNLVLQNDRRQIEGKHDIKQLCDIAKGLMAECKKLYESDTSEQMFTALKLVECFIVNIYNKTTDMTFTRYPINKKKKNHFYIGDHVNEVINIELLKKEFRYVHEMLSFVYYTLESAFENMLKNSRNY